MPSNLLARVILEGASALPEDRFVNDWSFTETGTLDPTTFTDILTMLAGFYTGVSPTTGRALHSFISNAHNRVAGGLLAIYNATGKEAGGPANPLGSPIFETPFLIGPSAAAATLPTECSAVVSMHANLTNVQEETGTTRPAARRRGRVYIGPLNTDAITADQDSAHLSSSFIQTVVDQFQSFNDFGAPVLSVWSRADAVFRPVVGGFVDNAVDIQRRRGQEATSRTLLAAIP